jgi:uncharacterized membrane protein
VPVLALASLVWLTLLVVTPLAPAALATLMYSAGAVICHQIPERSFHLSGFQLPVCARCLGIYGGAALAASVYVLGRARGAVTRSPMLSARVARGVFLIGAIPTLATVAVEWAGVWRGTNMIRALAGIVLGIGGAVVVMTALATLHYNGCQRRRPIGPSRMPPLS